MKIKSYGGSYGQGREEMRATGIVILAIIGVLILFAGGLAFRYFTADVRGQVQMQEEVMSGEFRQMSYDHFYNLYANVQSFEDQIKNQKTMVDATEGDEQARYRRNVNALMNQRAAVIRQYNADVRKEGTRGQFRASDLPRSILIEFEE